VLYIDIDIHHGDGVELAFYHTNRVMTLSLHKYNGDFFPATGKLDDNGAELGKYFALNVPLADGIDDAMYTTLFKTVVADAVAAFKPSAIVLQCGADSLGCDRLGAFNLSIAAHGACVDFVRAFGAPTLVLGGGGYNIKNVARCWAYETAVLVGAQVPDELPRTVYDSFFRDSQWKLHPPLTGRVDNANSPGALQRTVSAIREKLRFVQGAPSVQMRELPPDLDAWLREEAARNAELRGTAYLGESSSAAQRAAAAARNEFYDGEGDVDHEPAEAASAGAARGRTAAARTRARGSRRVRGRGRTASTAAGSGAAAAREEGAEDEAEGPATPARRARGRGRGRGRGRPRGRGRAPSTRSAAQAGAAEDEGDEAEPAAGEEADAAAEDAAEGDAAAPTPTPTPAEGESMDVDAGQT
jgi:hypothetical protein